MRIVRIKGEKLGGWIVAIYDIAAKNYVGFEIFILPGSKEVIARQLTAALGQFERFGVTGVLNDLVDLCKQYGVDINPEWKIYTMQKRGNSS